MTMELSGYNMFNYWKENSMIYLVYFILLVVYFIYDMKILYKILFYICIICTQIFVLINCLKFPVVEDNQYILWYQFFVILVALLCIIRMLNIYHALYSLYEDDEIHRNKRFYN